MDISLCWCKILCSGTKKVIIFQSLATLSKLKINMWICKWWICVLYENETIMIVMIKKCDCAHLNDGQMAMHVFWSHTPEWGKQNKNKINTHDTGSLLIEYTTSGDLSSWPELLMYSVQPVTKTLFQRCMYQFSKSKMHTHRITETCMSQEVCLYYRVHHWWWCIFMPLVTDVQYTVNHQKSILC